MKMTERVRALLCSAVAVLAIGLAGCGVSTEEEEQGLVEQSEAALAVTCNATSGVCSNLPTGTACGAGGVCTYYWDVFHPNACSCVAPPPTACPSTSVASCVGKTSGATCSPPLGGHCVYYPAVNSGKGSVAARCACQ